MKYECDGLGQFFYLKEEIFPVNISNILKSTLNGKIIKGTPVRVNKDIVMSTSQGMEWFKWASFSPLLDEVVILNPY